MSNHLDERIYYDVLEFQDILNKNSFEDYGWENYDDPNTPKPVFTIDRHILDGKPDVIMTFNDDGTQTWRFLIPVDDIDPEDEEYYVNGIKNGLTLPDDPNITYVFKTTRKDDQVDFDFEN